jgi:FKBP-type peptidyl-prolyl cis-trans isomerase
MTRLGSRSISSLLLIGPLAVLAAGCVGETDKASSNAARPAPAKAAAVAKTVVVPPPAPPVPAPADVATPPKDAVKLPNGIVTKVLQAGTGKDHPRDQDEFSVNYVGWRKNGEMFSHSAQPMSLRMAQVFPGWAETLKVMVVGEKRRTWIPSNLAYGDAPTNGTPAGDLTMDIELVDLVRIGDEPEVPKDLKEPPKTAKHTPSGLAYRVIKEGTGRTPGPTDAVLLKYTGFTTDGTAFDTTIRRGRAKTVQVSSVIKGWGEGLQLMKEGETAQFWVPEELAYGSNTGPSIPKGTLVFVTELVKIKEPSKAN